MVVCVQAHACLCLITVSSLFMFSVHCSKFSALIHDVFGPISSNMWHYLDAIGSNSNA